MTPASPARPACVDPVLGERSAESLGRRVPPDVEAHRQACLACELERIAFTALDEHATSPSPALAAWVSALVRLNP